MAKWLDIKGPVVADTVYADSTLVAKDVAFTLPGIEFLTADVQAMGNMTVPLIGLLENMELSITKIGVDNGLRRMNRLKKQSFEFRWVQNVVKSDGSTATEGCKAFVRTMPGHSRAGRRSRQRNRSREHLQRDKAPDLRKRRRDLLR